MQRTLCSIFYQDLRARRQYRRRDEEAAGFNTTFYIPAAPRDGYNLLVVSDMEEDYQFSSQSPRTTISKDTTGDKVAECLVVEWAGHVANEAIGGPGVFICRDLDEKDAAGKVIRPATKPSDRELKVSRASQTRWCEAWCLEASDYYRTGKRKLISDHVHVPAAVWLGKQFEWMNAPEQTFTSECPVCGAEMKPGKFKCISCGEVVDPMGYDRWKKGTLEAQVAVEKLKNEALKANPNIDPAALDLIGVGAVVQPKEPQQKTGGRHVYG